MRINVYSEEMTDEIEVIKKTADTGATFYGVRLLLKSHDDLHTADDDDDRSAVTFWFDRQDTALDLHRAMLDAILTYFLRIEQVS